jgi:hypothetical protein
MKTSCNEYLHDQRQLLFPVNDNYNSRFGVRVATVFERGFTLRVCFASLRMRSGESGWCRQLWFTWARGGAWPGFIGPGSAASMPPHPVSFRPMAICHSLRRCPWLIYP